MKRFLLVLLVSFYLVLFTAAGNDRYESVGGKIMCSCGCNQMLLKCNHVGCPDSDRMIRELKAQVANTANSDEDVLNWFRRTYGITVVVEPATHGFELTIWVVPPILVVLTVLLVVFLIRRWRMRAHAIQITEFAGNPQLDAYRIRARKETEL